MMGVGMTCYRAAPRERTMNMHEVVLRPSTKKSRWCEAAELVGISDRQIRRWERWLEKYGYDGLLDHREASQPQSGTGPSGHLNLSRTVEGDTGLG